MKEHFLFLLTIWDDNCWKSNWCFIIIIANYRRYLLKIKLIFSYFYCQLETIYIYWKLNRFSLIFFANFRRYLLKMKYIFPYIFVVANLKRSLLKIKLIFPYFYCLFEMIFTENRIDFFFFFDFFLFCCQFQTIFTKKSNWLSLKLLHIWYGIYWKSNRFFLMNISNLRRYCYEKYCLQDLRKSEFRANCTVLNLINCKSC